MKVVVKFAFVYQLRVVSVHWLNLDCYLEVGTRVDCLVNLTEGSLIDFSHNFKIFADLFQHLWHEINFKRKYIISHLNDQFLIFRGISKE